MAAPTYRCPFKIDPTLKEGITCENTNCGMYDSTEEHCIAVEYFQVMCKINGKEDPNPS